MKIKNRLYISAGISIVLVVILVSLVLLTSGRMAEGNKKQELLNSVRVGVSELDIVTYDYLLHREERMEEQWHLKYGSLGKILDKAAGEQEMIPIRADYAALESLFSQVAINSEKIQKLIQEGASQEKIDAVIRLEERLVAQLLIKSYSVIVQCCFITFLILRLYCNNGLSSSTTNVLVLKKLFKSSRLGTYDCDTTVCERINESVRNKVTCNLRFLAFVFILMVLC